MVICFTPVTVLVVLFCSSGDFNGIGALVFGDGCRLLGVVLLRVKNALSLSKSFPP
jgi:hypothetical protein